MKQLLADYRATLDRLKMSRYMDFPKEVSFETQTVCNAACSFCPYTELERKGEKMPDRLIAKIIQDLREIPEDLPFIVSPFKVNDPLLDVRLFDILWEINGRLPNAKVRIFTNGSPLNEKNIARLNAVNKVEHLWVSLNHYEAAPYEELMKIPFDRTLANLDLLHRKKASGWFDHDVWVSRVCDETPADQGFVDFVKDRYPLFGLGTIFKSEWLGQVPGLNSLRKIPLVGCARWWELSIISTGKVSFCCMDGKAEYPIGDVSESSVLEVYNNPAYRKFRESFVTRAEGSPCLACTHF